MQAFPRVFLVDKMWVPKERQLFWSCLRLCPRRLCNRTERPSMCSLSEENVLLLLFCVNLVHGFQIALKNSREGVGFDHSSQWKLTVEPCKCGRKDHIFVVLPSLFLSSSVPHLQWLKSELESQLRRDSKVWSEKRRWIFSHYIFLSWTSLEEVRCFNFKQNPNF